MKLFKRLREFFRELRDFREWEKSLGKEPKMVVRCDACNKIMMAAALDELEKAVSTPVRFPTIDRMVQQYWNYEGEQNDRPRPKLTRIK